MSVSGLLRADADRFCARLAAAAIAAVLLASLAAGCGTQRAGRPTPPAHQIRGVAFAEPEVSPAPYAAGDLAFGLDLLHLMCMEQPGQNVVLSPTSLATSLGMAYLGARGTTATAMAAVLHLPHSRRPLAGLHTRSQAMAGLDSPGVTVATADEVWADPKLLPLEGYLNAVATGYGAGLRQVPLLSDKGRAADEIDATVADVTRGRIPKLLTAAQLDQALFVLTDAIYLNAAWAAPFSPDDVPHGPFAAPGGRVQVRYLEGQGYKYAVASGWTAVSLPFRSGSLRMEALLPPLAASGSCAGPPAAAVRTLGNSLSRDHGPTAAIDLPEVRLSTQAIMNDELTKLGMGIAFTGSADFSKMSPRDPAIGLVVHDATLQLGPKGTIASAASAVVIVPVDLPLHVIMFDRPYVLMVTNTRTGEPLFLARVANPSLQ